MHTNRWFDNKTAKRTPGTQAARADSRASRQPGMSTAAAKRTLRRCRPRDLSGSSRAAALVAATRSDTENTNTTFTVREIDDDVPIAVPVSPHASKAILELAGATQVLHLGDLMGQALARRVAGMDGRVHEIGQFGDLHIAEASVNGTELVNRTIRDLQRNRNRQLPASH